jgi:PhzF family phenazine biosynthesis protein
MQSDPAAKTSGDKGDPRRRFVKVPLVQIDAFAGALFEGNPAAVMSLPEWLPDEVLQQVAMENNLSETAFLVKSLPAGIQAPDPAHPSYHLRWFTPAVEVDLCGHATMAAASYLFDDSHPEAEKLQFHTRSGYLSVTRSAGGRYTMDFPSEIPVPVAIDPDIVKALGVPVTEALKATDLIYMVQDPQTVIDLAPDLTFLAALPVRGTIVTAPGTGTEYDFVSRWFGAEAGVAEDPVTGSAHCQLAPLWAERLGKDQMLARQASARGGTVSIDFEGERTRLTGRCVRFMEGTAFLPR